MQGFSSSQIQEELAVVGNNLKVIHHSKVHQELFSLSLQTNIKINLASIAANVIHTKLHDATIVIFKYLSYSGYGDSWKYCYDEVRTEMLGKRGTDYKTKSALDGVLLRLCMI